ncbi:MAG: hypothetical protein Q8P95_00535 [bacterium]|nr:hypothetical protein [bacterium]
MRSEIEFQIAELLRVAHELLGYCNYISNYPTSQNSQNYDPGSKIDQFYKNVCNSSYRDCIIIVDTLMDKDRRVISFKNWKVFAEKRKEEIDLIFKDFVSSGLKKVRDEMMAHVSAKNSNNRFPSMRREGIVNQTLIESLQEILDRLTKEFFEFTNTKTQTYSKKYFDRSRAIAEIKTVMNLAKPKLTNNFVI